MLSGNETSQIPIAGMDEESTIPPPKGHAVVNAKPPTRKKKTQRQKRM